MNRMSAHRNEMKLCNAKLQHSWRPASPLAKLFLRQLYDLLDRNRNAGWKPWTTHACQKLERLRQSNTATGI